MRRDKKSRSKILTEIVNFLKMKGPKSMYELSKNLNSNWDTIRDNVELLQKFSIVSISDGKVTLNKKIDSSSDDVIFNIPISNEVRKRIYIVSEKICKEWERKEGKKPDKIHLQKALVEIADKFERLNIPRGWYLFGKMILINVDPCNLQKKIEQFGDEKLPVDTKEIESEIEKTVNIIRSKKTFSELINYQYSKYNKRDYQLKNNIYEMFSMGRFDKKDFSRLLYELIFEFPLDKKDNLNLNVMELLKESVSIMINESQNIEPKDYRESNILFDMFRNFWDIYATYNLFNSLEGDTGYDKSYIKICIEDAIEKHVQSLTHIFKNYVSICV